MWGGLGNGDIMNRLKSFFELDKHKTTLGREAGAGATTFLTMSYIIFVQPAVLSITGMDFGSVMMATCLSSAFATILMAILANYPIAQAPAMGHNFFFAFTACGPVAIGGFGLEWQQALAAVFISGMIIIALSLLGLLDAIINSVPLSIRLGLAVGIGLLIALLGLQWGGIVVDRPGVLVGLGDLKSLPAMLTIFGTFLMAILMVRKAPGGILLGILATAAIALATGAAKFHGIAGAPPSMAPTFLKLDFAGLFGKPGFWLVIAIFLFLDLFDTIGTLLGVATKAGLVDDDGKLPKGARAIQADAGGTVLGAALGTSTVTSYIESASGVAAGGRTGLTAMVTAGLFLLAVFFAPLAQTIGGGYEVSKGVYLYPVIAPALIIVGSLMLTLVKDIPWDDLTEAFSAYLTIIITPLTLSITEGLSAGFISYSILKTAEGKFMETHPVIHGLAILFVLRYAFLM